jgi:hypothetical protein
MPRQKKKVYREKPRGATLIPNVVHSKQKERTSGVPQSWSVLKLSKLRFPKLSKIAKQ